MSARERNRPPSPFPPALADAPTASLEASQLDPVEEQLIQQLAEPRLFQVGGKRILRGRLPGFAARRESIERRFGALPADVFFERVEGETFATVSRPKSAPLPREWPVNLLLFLATLATTAWAGAYWNGVDPFAGMSGAQPDVAGLLRGLGAGLPFALSLLVILTCHEFGHYFAARRYGLDATLPFYIPVPPPLSPVGTLGAVIKMRTPLYNRRILLDVGAAGPLAGIAAALPILILGILRAPLAPVIEGPGLVFHEPLLFRGLELLLRPDIPPGGDIQATSLVLAGWLGLFVTALNLLPVGQLDGGHVLYALLGRGQHAVGLACFVALVAMGVLWEGWWLWVLLILLLVRIRHPPVLDLDVPLDGRRKAIGWVTAALFVLCVHPVPFELR